MEFLYDVTLLEKFPTLPGVYLMKNQDDIILYVGKAKDLRQRVKQYFLSSRDERPMLPFLISQVAKIDTIVVHSEKEALLLENNLIKKYRPKYNILLKDDKTYIAIRINIKHPWPALEVVRLKGKPTDDALYFGPYVSHLAARETIDILQKMFPLRQCSDAELIRRTRPCILYSLGKCIAPCVNFCTAETYRGHVKRTVAFLKGQDKEIVKEFEQEMHRLAAVLEFEEAARYQKILKQFEETLEKQYVDIPQGADADLIGLYREADEVVLCQLFVRGGKLLGSRTFSFSKTLQDNQEIIEAFLLQHYDAKSMPVKEILLSEELKDVESISEILSTIHRFKIQIDCPQKGSKKNLIDLAQLNAKTAFKQKKDAKVLKERMLLQLQETCRLNRYPQKVECIDNSHLAGSSPVSVIVTFKDGLRHSSGYRTYKASQENVSDDYLILKETLLRRYSGTKAQEELPDLLIIDGGKGHLNVALNTLKELRITTVDVIGLAKEEARHDRGSTQEQIFLPNIKDPILLKKNSPVLFFLQEVRDEAHRFAINFQKKQRTKKMVRSTLDDIPGIGPLKKKALLIHFKSVKAVKEASIEELCQVPGINQKIAKKIYDYFAASH